MGLHAYRWYRGGVRRFARPILVALLPVIGLLHWPAVAIAAEDCQVHAQSVAPAPDLLDQFLNRAGVRERIHEWGRDIDEVRHDIVNLRAGELETLRCLLTRMSDDPSIERDALFLVVVSIMREQRLFKNIIQFSRRVEN